MASKGQLTGMRGVYLVAAELARLGFVASPTSRNAVGRVLVQMGERIPLQASTGGRLMSVDVGAGQRVTRGQVLARLTTDAGEQELTAPRDGIVGDVPLREGQSVAAGQTVVWLVDPNALPGLLALFPGTYRAELVPGLPLRYHLTGIPFPIETTIDAVGTPEEALRIARGPLWEGVSLEDGAVLVRARVPSRNYTVDGRARIYMDAMTGRALVPLGSERLLVAWFPGLRGVLP